ncbi:MAG: four helix bundle protein [Flavobacteriaceae bacterium]|nr:four helix bundle protein [Flavobacteriaceae bacterium]
MDKFTLENRLIDFSVAIIKMNYDMANHFAANHLASQIIRSSTSAAPNYGEAHSAVSTKDFIFRMGICLKE